MELLYEHCVNVVKTYFRILPAHHKAKKNNSVAIKQLKIKIQDLPS